MADKLRVTVLEKEFEIELSEKDGKVFAKAHIDHFGEVSVSDFGGGRDGAVKNLRARICNILGTLRDDEAREARRNQAAADQQAAAPEPAKA